MGETHKSSIELSLILFWNLQMYTWKFKHKNVVIVYIIQV